MKILWKQARKLGRCDSFRQNLTADSISVLVEFDKSETNLMMRQAGLFDSPSININQYQLAPISINWHQSASIGINQYQLALINDNVLMSLSIKNEESICISAKMLKRYILA